MRPSLKKNDLCKKNFKNYWPVINITFLSKVDENVAATQTYNYLETYKLMLTMHSAYRKHYSEMTLLRVMNEVLRSPLRCRISTPRFLSGLWQNWPCDSGRIKGSSPTSVSQNWHGIWFKSYHLENRGQSIIIGVSTPRPLCHEVPHGSILGALLSTLYMPPTGCYCSP